MVLILTNKLQKCRFPALTANVRLIILTHMSTNSENLVNISPLNSEIICI